MQLAIKSVVLVIILVSLIMLVARYIFSNTALPEGVGIGVMASCPESPNCVSTQAISEVHKIRPIPLGSRNGIETLDAIAKIIESTPRSRLISRTDSYMHIEFRSPFWNFVDDVEFFVNVESSVIESRSAARMGYTDFGANRARFEAIANQLEN